MLTPSIYGACEGGVEALAGSGPVRGIARGQAGEGSHQCQSRLFMTEAEAFLADERLHDEVFGATGLVIECADIDELHAVAEALEGQLTATLQMDDGDLDAARSLLERKAGRVLINGWATGGEVCHAVVHGGPFPATSDACITSVGSAAIRRFLRPVCYQNLPAALLPEALQDANPLGVTRLVDARREL